MTLKTNKGLGTTVLNLNNHTGQDYLQTRIWTFDGLSKYQKLMNEWRS